MVVFYNWWYCLHYNKYLQENGTHLKSLIFFQKFRVYLDTNFFLGNTCIFFFENFKMAFYSYRGHH